MWPASWHRLTSAPPVPLSSVDALIERTGRHYRWRAMPEMTLDVVSVTHAGDGTALVRMEGRYRQSSTSTTLSGTQFQIAVETGLIERA